MQRGSCTKQKCWFNLIIKTSNKKNDLINTRLSSIFIFSGCTYLIYINHANSGYCRREVRFGVHFYRSSPSEGYQTILKGIPLLGRVPYLVLQPMTNHRIETRTHKRNTMRLTEGTTSSVKLSTVGLWRRGIRRRRRQQSKA